MTKAERPLWQTALSKALSGNDVKFVTVGYVTVEFEVGNKVAEARVKPESILNNIGSSLKETDFEIRKKYRMAAEILGVSEIKCEYISKIKYRGKVLYEHISQE